jgi:broad specificity phosphatase PhoE
VGTRADRLIAEARGADGEVIFFGHGHMLRVVGARWVGLPPEDGGILKLGTGALCTLGYEHELPVLVHWNEPVG